MPADVPLQRSLLHAGGALLGIDASSVLAALALGVGEQGAALHTHLGVSVLDLCCAPGSKLALLADLMDRRGSLTGVDVRQERLRVAAGQARRAGLVGPGVCRPGWRLRLVEADGRRFSDGPKWGGEDGRATELTSSSGYVG